MLAGGAPLLSERLGARGGPPIDLHDPRVFYETSSYGPAAIDMIAGTWARHIGLRVRRPVVWKARPVATRVYKTTARSRSVRQTTAMVRLQPSTSAGFERPVGVAAPLRP